MTEHTFENAKQFSKFLKERERIHFGSTGYLAMIFGLASGSGGTGSPCCAAKANRFGMAAEAAETMYKDYVLNIKEYDFETLKQMNSILEVDRVSYSSNGEVFLTVEL